MGVESGVSMGAGAAGRDCQPPRAPGAVAAASGRQAKAAAYAAAQAAAAAAQTVRTRDRFGSMITVAFSRRCNSRGVSTLIRNMKTSAGIQPQRRVWQPHHACLRLRRQPERLRDEASAASELGLGARGGTCNCNSQRGAELIECSVVQHGHRRCRSTACSASSRRTRASSSCFRLLVQSRLGVDAQRTRNGLHWDDGHEPVGKLLRCAHAFASAQQARACNRRVNEAQSLDGLLRLALRLRVQEPTLRVRACEVAAGDSDIVGRAPSRCCAPTATGMARVASGASAAAAPSRGCARGTTTVAGVSAAVGTTGR